MLSIIMPFYRKDREFNFVFTHYNLKILNAYSELELIIVIDDPNHYQEMISHLKMLVEQQQILFAIKIVLNEKAHEWRPPCIAINVGIQHAEHNKLLVISPETILLQNSLEQLYKACSDETFAIGIIKFVHFDEAIYRDPKELILARPTVNLADPTSYRNFAASSLC